MALQLTDLWEPCDCCDGTGICSMCGGAGAGVEYRGEFLRDLLCDCVQCVGSGACFNCDGAGEVPVAGNEVKPRGEQTWS